MTSSPSDHDAALQLSSTGLRLSRRSVVLGGAATAALLLSGCGSSSDDDNATELGLTPADDALVLVGAFPPNDYVVSSTPQRLIMILAEPAPPDQAANGQAAGLPVNDRIPDSLTFALHQLDDSGQRTTVAEGIEVERHDEGIPQSYYPLRATFDEPGTYVATTTAPNGDEISATFAVVGPAAAPLVQPGSPMRNQPTPTVADPLGVASICTRDPQCPLHEVSLSDSLAAGRPTALLVSTPAFCQTAICGPVLDLFVPQQDAFPDIQFIHCEVYQDDKGFAGGNLIPAVSELGLTFEPSLFLVAADGTLQERLDLTFDQPELIAGLQSISSA